MENHIVGAPCGVMDQMASACGEANKLLAMICQVCIITSYKNQRSLIILDFRLNRVLLVIDTACRDRWPRWNSQPYPGLGNWFRNKTQVGFLLYIYISLSALRALTVVLSKKFLPILLQRDKLVRWDDIHLRVSLEKDNWFQQKQFFIFFSWYM